MHRKCVCTVYFVGPNCVPQNDRFYLLTCKNECNESKEKSEKPEDNTCQGYVWYERLSVGCHWLTNLRRLRTADL